MPCIDYALKHDLPTNLKRVSKENDISYSIELLVAQWRLENVYDT